MTAAGLGAGLLGSFTVALTSAIFLPFCADKSGMQDRVVWTVAMTVWGLLGSVLDSVLGGLLQASVIDKRSGKIVEGSGGRKVSLAVLIARLGLTVGLPGSCPSGLYEANRYLWAVRVCLFHGQYSPP